LDKLFFEIKQVEYLPVIYPSEKQKQNAVRLSQKVCVGGYNYIWRLLFYNFCLFCGEK